MLPAFAAAAALRLLELVFRAGVTTQTRHMIDDYYFQDHDDLRALLIAYEVCAAPSSSAGFVLTKRCFSALLLSFVHSSPCTHVDGDPDDGKSGIVALGTRLPVPWHWLNCCIVHSLRLRPTFTHLGTSCSLHHLVWHTECCLGRCTTDTVVRCLLRACSPASSPSSCFSCRFCV